MLRRNLLLAWILAAFGLGLLFGLWIEGSFLAHCIGFGLLVFGCLNICRK